MPPWLIKAATQRLLSTLPKASALNRMLQTHLTHSLELSRERAAAQLGRCARHLEAFVGPRGQLPDRVLEVGTGWQPLLPLGFHLCGCGEVWTVDRTALVTLFQLRRTVAAVAELIRVGRFQEVLPRRDPQRCRRFLEQFEPAGAPIDFPALEAMRIHYRAGTTREWPAGPFDLMVTNSVLEHLREEELRGLLVELRRRISPSGVASHFIDLGDHYATFDRRIDVYNFLKFSDWTWKWVNSRLHWQSRLRISDYRRLFKEAAWRIAEEASQRGGIADLRRVRLAPRFRRHSTEDLLVYRSWVRLDPD